jgi:hypothetical protein
MLQLMKTKLLKGELKPTKQKRKLGEQYQKKGSENRKNMSALFPVS